MKNIAIIAEYNPMHKGHIYQIEKIKEIYPNSSITVLSSGTFVQRGDFSIINKFYKAESAVKNGVDLFLEMPSMISLQSADNFAYYSVKILDKLGNIDFLAFGVDSSDLDSFTKIVDFQEKHEKEIEDIQVSFINDGASYKSAYQLALNQLAKKHGLKEVEIEEISRPNNTLAFQYMRALKKLGSHIKALPILREDGGYANDELDDHVYQSASTIRKLVLEAKDISAYVPKEIADYFCLLKSKDINPYKYSINYFNDLKPIFNYIINVEEKDPRDITGFEPGMLNLLKNNFSNDLNKMIEKSVNKRHSRSRLRRFVINYILDIKQEDIGSLDQISYIRPLAFNDKARSLLKNIKGRSEINIINSLSDINKLDKINQKIISKDIKAYKLLSGHLEDFTAYDYKHMGYIASK